MRIEDRYRPFAFAFLVVVGLILLAAVLQLLRPPSKWVNEAPTEATPTAEEAAIVTFLESYFASWSQGDMEAYGDHFHPEATITLLEGGQVRFNMQRDLFVQMQAGIIASMPTLMTERMTGYELEIDEQAASATVDWLLYNGIQETVGVDRFILSRDGDGRWLIVSLVFYTTESRTDTESE